MSDSTRSFWRWAFGFTGILTLLAMFDLTRLLSHLGVALFQSFWTIALIVMFLGFALTDAASAYRSHGPPMQTASTLLFACAAADFLTGVAVLIMNFLQPKQAAANWS